jgi:hypothetical protein
VKLGRGKTTCFAVAAVAAATVPQHATAADPPRPCTAAEVGEGAQAFLPPESAAYATHVVRVELVPRVGDSSKLQVDPATVAVTGTPGQVTRNKAGGQYFFDFTPPAPGPVALTLSYVIDQLNPTTGNPDGALCTATTTQSLTIRAHTTKAPRFTAFKAGQVAEDNGVQVPVFKVVLLRKLPAAADASPLAVRAAIAAGTRPPRSPGAALFRYDISHIDQSGDSGGFVFRPQSVRLGPLKLDLGPTDAGSSDGRFALSLNLPRMRNNQVIRRGVFLEVDQSGHSIGRLRAAFACRGARFSNGSVFPLCTYPTFRVG